MSLSGVQVIKGIITDSKGVLWSLNGVWRYSFRAYV